jgi:hypothetical protein
VSATLLQHLGADEALDQSEDVSVGTPLDLAQHARLLGREKAESIDERESVGQELAREIKSPSAHQIALNLPLGFLRHLDAASVTGGAPRLGIQIGYNGTHFQLLEIDIQPLLSGGCYSRNCGVIRE